MCGRYTLTADAESIQLAFGLDDVSAWEQPRYNIAPTQVVPVITNREPKTLSLLKWGLVPSWAKDPKIGSRMINARAETAPEKPSFRTAFKRRRCLIPADGYYEWAKRDGRKAPMYLQRSDRELFAFAGLWENWKQAEGDWLQTFTILTTAANEAVRPFHHRMTVMIEPDDYETWLSEEALSPDEWLPILTRCESLPLTASEVSTLVNKPANDFPEVIQPLEAASQRDLL